MWQEKKGTEKSWDILTTYEYMNIITYEQMIKRKSTKDKEKRREDFRWQSRSQNFWRHTKIW